MKDDYPWFHYSEFWKCIAFGAVLEFCKRKIMAALYPIMYLYVKDKQDPVLRNKRALKASKYVFMTFYYTSITIYGYIVLKDSAWLPDYMGGKGSWEGMWKGMPYIEPCQGATTYAMLQLGYHGSDFIFHLIKDERENDFMEMTLHHASTFLLISSMTLANALPIGCVIAFLHDVSDIPVATLKLCTALEDCELPAVANFLVVISIWFYFRNMCLTHLVYNIWIETEYKEPFTYYQPIINISALLCSFLVVLQWYWLWLFIKCFLFYKKTGAAEDL